jgi:Na+-driven multidrug efflux pump
VHNVWIGTSMGGLHHDAFDNTLIQLSGTKRVIVYPPAPQMGVWRLAWPAVLTNLLQSTVGLVGTKVVGGLGADALAAAVVGQRLLFVLQAMLTAISAGTTALVARAWGAGDREDAAQIVSSSLLFAVGIGLVATLLGALSAGPFATLFGHTGTVHSDSVIYMRNLAATQTA